jgi:hypothetical protein
MYKTNSIPYILPGYEKYIIQPIPLFFSRCTRCNKIKQDEII